MCRHLAWLGEPCSVASLVLDPPYGLLVQSYAPRRQKHGLMNADGWGVGFFDHGVARRWRSAAPLWGDTSFASVAPALSSGCVVAAVRSASIGMPIEPSASAPFTDGQWLLSHNGLVDRAVLPLSAEVLAGGVDRRQRVACGADLRPRTRRAWRHHRRSRRGGPQRQAEHLGGQRNSTTRHHVGRHLVGAAPGRRRGAGQRTIRRQPRMAGDPRPAPRRGRGLSGSMSPPRRLRVELIPLKGSS